MKNLLRLIALIFSAFLAVVAAHAQAPVNDQFLNAITLTGPIVTTTGSNVGATKQFGGGGGGEPSIGNTLGLFGGASVWWNWTAAASGETTVDTQGSDFNTLLGVFTGEAQNRLTLVAGNDDFEANQWSRVTFAAVAGTTYRIMVDGFRSGPGFGAPAMGNITLHVKGVGGLDISLTNGMVFTVGEPIPVSVNFTPDFPNPPATRVDFYRRGSPFTPPTLFASVSNAPFSALATNVPPGSNSFYVAAFDSLGNPVESPAASVLVQNVGVTLLTPFEDTAYASADPITVTAWAYLPAGSITNIEFMVDGVKFAEDDAPPYSGVWSNVVGGSHRFTAVGRSDAGTRFTSQPVNVGVATTLIATGAVWKYLDNGSDQGTTWIDPNFDDTSWASGPAELGYGDGDEATVVEDNPTPGYGANDMDRYTTTYFRRAFDVSDVSGFASIIATIYRDDAAVVYLNGREVFRTSNLPAAPEPILYDTLATGQAVEETIDKFTINPTNFVSGRNVFAVEIHQQAASSSDISFNFGLQGIPAIIHNLSPIVALTNPLANAYFLAPSSITLEATASDGDGSVAKVEFFAGTTKIGEDTTEPYSVVWNNPPVAAHVLTAVATDDQGATTTSDEIPIVVYDALGTPVTKIISPLDGAVMEGPTNLLITATANAINGVTNVQFLVNGVEFGNDATPPYQAVWTSSFLSNSFVTVVSDANGVRGTSDVVSVFITIPPTNLIAPTISTQKPPAFATVTNLSSITIVFSERVQNVDASDLLLNGIPATGVTGSGSNYVFTFPPQAYGEVEVAWAGNHGITDFGFPSNLPFDELGQTAQWEYFIIDRTPPGVAARVPARGATVTNLAQIDVTFTEVVTGVDAADLLVNGTAAQAVTGSGSNYIFSVLQPPAGTVNITWATNNDIFDVSDVPNAFAGGNTNSTWSFTLDTRVTLIQSNSNWRFVKGFAEASAPADAWRQPEFDDAGWSNAPAPFFFGDPYTNATIQGTLLSDMQSNYTTVFLRQEFTVANRGAITNLVINHQSDDGFIAWLNGVEVLRYNVPGGELPYNATASTAANEPSQRGAAYIVATLTNNAVSRLVPGRNVLAIQALNQNLTNSSDFGFNAQLYYFPVDASAVPPRLVAAEPTPGDVFYLTNVTIHFSEGVSGVDPTDMLVNGVPAADVSSTTNSTYTFSFPQPAYGPVLITWATNHGIVDFDDPPRAFDGGAAAAQVSYTLLNPSSPRIATQVPAASTTITGLTSIAVTFTEAVTGIDAADMLISGVPASGVSSADNTTYTFTFAQPPFGTVTVRWATNHGITDLELPPAPFDPTRFGGQWNYTLIDPVPAVTFAAPTNNAYVLAPADVPVRASATDNDGTVASLEIYFGPDKVAETNGSSISLTIPNVPMGRYEFRGVATDNQGLRGTSAPVVLNVVTSLPITLVRGPYLQIGSPTGGVVRWRTDFISDALVYYGTDVDNLTNVAVELSVTNEHIVTITGLQPDSRYFYSIGSAGQRLVGGTNDGANYWFDTSPPVGTRRPVRFWALGDSGTAGNGPPDRVNSVRDAFSNYAATNGPADLWLMLGDNAYNSGTDDEHQRAIFDIFPTMLRNKFLWPVLGNHETAQSTTAATFPYLDIFSLPRDGEAGGVPSGTEKYYSFDYANIHFLALDSMTSGRTTNTAMAQWLVDDLDSTSQEWVIAYFHHSLYTKGTHDSDAESDLVELRQNIIPLLEAHGVDIVLMGHSHVYERSYLLDRHYGLSSTLTESNKIDGGDGRLDGTGAYRKNDEGRGVVYTIAGSSGQALGGPLNHPAHIISLNELGSLVIDVTSNRLDAKFLTSTGDIDDHYTIFKPALEPAAPLNFVALPTGATEVTLGWTAGSSNQLGYAIERSIDGINFVEQLTVPGDTTSAVNAGLQVNATYYYRIRATNSFGASDYSNVAGVSTVAPTSAPLAPVALAASADDGVRYFRSQMVLRWQDRSTNEAAFLIERSVDGAAFEVVATVAANITSYLDHGLASATPHYYRVRAVNALGQSAPSNVAEDETHPQSHLARAGDSVTFHAGVEGVAPVRYQWRFLGVPIVGQTNETLVLDDAQLADEGDYNVVVIDALDRVISNPAYLFVVAPPKIVSEPQDMIGLAGMTSMLDMMAVGTEPMTYQWLRNGTLIPGATSPTLTIQNVQLSDQAGYYAIVQNDFGSATSRVAALSVYLQPGLQPVADIFTEVLRTVVVTNTATDGNSPSLDLAFSLAPGAPTNAVVDPVTGVFRWTPDRSQAPSTNLITVRVADKTRPEVSNTTSFTIHVNDFIEVTVGSTIQTTGSDAAVPFDFYSTAPLTELRCDLELPWDYFTTVSAEALSPQNAAVSLQYSSSNVATLTFTALGVQTFQGTQQLARLHFMTASNQISAFVPLQVRAMGWSLARSSVVPTLLANHGRVTLIGTQSLLEARVTAGQRQLVLYGHTGVTYTVQSRFGLATNNAWANRTSFFMTNNVRVVPAPSATAPLIFYRLRE